MSYDHWKTTEPVEGDDFGPFARSEIGELLEELDRLRAINAKLLAALKLARDTIGCYEWDDSVDEIIDAAIAKAEANGANP